MASGEVAARLLDDVTAYLRRYVILTEHQAHAVAAWVLLTYVYEHGDTVPYLIVTSAEKRSGKTRLLECLNALCSRPLLTTSLTEAVLFRAIHLLKPTLLIDETDAIFRDHRGGPSERQEALRGILNMGYRKQGVVHRVAPGNADLEAFNVYGPKALAGIGHLPDTIEDRGLCIRLQRKMSDEIVERFRMRTGHAEGKDIAASLFSWSEGSHMNGYVPVMPDGLDDRAQDAYEMLVVIADMAGAAWPEKIREALISLRVTEDHQPTLGMRVLSDLGSVMESIGKVERIPTVDLLALLYSLGDEPWEEWWGPSEGKKAAQRLARALGEFAVKPEQWRDGEHRYRGYKVAELVESRNRWVVDETIVTSRQPAVDAASVCHDVPFVTFMDDKTEAPEPTTESGGPSLLDIRARIT